MNIKREKRREVLLGQIRRGEIISWRTAMERHPGDSWHTLRHELKHLREAGLIHTDKEYNLIAPMVTRETPTPKGQSDD